MSSPDFEAGCDRLQEAKAAAALAQPAAARMEEEDDGDDDATAADVGTAAEWPTWEHASIEEEERLLAREAYLPAGEP